MAKAPTATNYFPVMATNEPVAASNRQLNLPVPTWLARAGRWLADEADAAFGIFGSFGATVRTPSPIVLDSNVRRDLGLAPTRVDVDGTALAVEEATSPKA